MAKTGFKDDTTMIIYDKNGEIELSILYKTKEETYHVYNKDDYKNKHHILNLKWLYQNKI